MADRPLRHRRILRQHVETDRLLGVDAVPVSELAAVLPAEAATPAASSARTPASPPGRAVAEPPPASLLAAGQALPELSPDEKRQQLEAMDRDEVRGCTKCGLCTSRTQTVFGEGSFDADLMFVGEGPGQTEDETGRPFVGRAGELLTKMIEAMGLSREQVFIANIVKCRPPNNRTPTPDEVDACSDYLRRQIMIIRPKVLVSLGGPATKFLLNTRQGITKIRGTWHQYEGLLPDGPALPVMPTFHPAYVLRAYTRENRGKVWSDLQQVIERLEGAAP